MILGCEPLGGRLLGVQSLKGLVTCTLVIWGCSFWLVEVCVGVFVQLVVGVWWEEEDSLLTDNESYANQLPAATAPYANMAIVETKCLLGWHQRAFQVDPRISLTSPLFHS